ncbi:MAG TPA: trypsin-like serine protease [Chthoniobacteraceae bacterium]|jgi:V8-like Glu-specific endopeptidase
MHQFFSRLILLLTLAASVAHGQQYPQPVSEMSRQQFPYSMVGLLDFFSGSRIYTASGTVIAERTVLTAGHNLFDRRAGWSTDLLFLRAYHQGEAADEGQIASRIFVLGGYRPSVKRYGGNSFLAFASDLGLLRFTEPAGAGGHAGWTADRALLEANIDKVALGYGAEDHDGEELLSVGTSSPFEKVFGAFLESDSLYFEGGMSGGPLFSRTTAGDLTITGVIVSGSVQPVSGGIRSLNPTAARLIYRYGQ